MQTKVQKWGNSLGLRIPRAIAKDVGLEAGAEVELTIRSGGVVMKLVRRKKYSLRDLLRAIHSRNLHSEVETGAPRGREVW